MSDPSSVYRVSENKYSDLNLGPGLMYTDWRTLKDDGYDTKTNFKFDHGLVVKPGEHSTVAFVERVICTEEEWLAARDSMDRRNEELRSHPKRLEWFEKYTAQLRPHRLLNGKMEVVKKYIPVYHTSQTQPGKFRERTKAIIRYGNVFWRTCNRANYIKRNRDTDNYDAKWFTKDIAKIEHGLMPFEFFNEGKLLDHINQREIYGVKPDPSKPQWWGGTDLDLHIEKGGRPAIFLRQVEAILALLHGKGWIICLGRDCVNGLHFIKIYDQPKMVATIRAEIRAMLNELSARHPDLDIEAIAAGMKPFHKQEIFPNPNCGFRLPLGMGYTALTDHPLQLVHYHTRDDVELFGADVEGLMNWDGTEMPLEDKLGFIRQRVPQSQVDQDIKIETTAKTIEAESKRAEQTVAKELTDSKLLGKMRGRFKKVLVEFYSGRLQVPKSLQTGILLGVNALWAINYPLEDRADYLLGLLQGIDITNADFSSRINNGDWDQVHDDIGHIIDINEKLRANPSNPRIEQSNGILRKWAKVTDKSGFNFGDPSTWNRCEKSTGDRSEYRFTPTAEDVELIRTEIAPVFSCDTQTAVEAVIKMVQLTAIKTRNGDGMNKKYRRKLLTDMGIRCQENSKLARCWEVVEKAGFIYLRQRHVFNPSRLGKGRAKGYGVGKRVKERVYGVRTENQEAWPTWLRRLKAEQDIGIGPTVHEPDPVDPEWPQWTEQWLKRELSHSYTHS